MSKKLPPLPPLRQQTGIPLVGRGRSRYMNEESSQLDEYPLQSSFRPYYGSSSSVENQQIGIAIQNQKKWLGSHFMPFQIHSQSNAAGPSRLYSDKTRQTLGNHEDDDTPIGPYRAVTYEARFFGKDVDIVSLEGGPSPYSLPEEEHEGATYFFGAENHPEFRIVPDSEVTPAPGGGPNTVSVTNRNILADDYLPNLGDAPYGNYPDIGSRIHFIDWDDHQEKKHRRHTIIKDPEVQLHSLRYDPNFYSGIHKARKSGLTSHVMGTFSAAGGVASGFAKRANFYPIYHNSWSDELDPLRRILHWHKNKDRNPNIKYGEGDDLTKGVRNPTILIWEFHSRNQKHFFVPVERIASLTHAGHTTNRPAGGWGTNLQPFVDMHQIPYRIEDPENAGTWYWAVSVGKGGSMLPGFGENVRYKKMMETLWDEGIVLCVSAGNSAQVFAKRDDAEHSGSYFVTDPNSKYYDNSYNTLNYIDQHDVITSGPNGDTFYPFRAAGPTGCKRDKSIDIAAGQLSETNRALDSYTSRGPGIDIIGTGAGEFSASAKTEFSADTNLGSGSYLDPAANEFVAGTDWSGYQLHPVYNDDDYAYPFEDGQELVISDLGTSSSAVADWNAYLGLSTVSAGSFEKNRRYEITNLGSGTSSQNQDRWNTFLGRTSVAAGEYRDAWGSGIRWEIVNLGSGTNSENQTRWNEYFGINLNSPNTYSVGDQFISTKSFKLSSHIDGAVVKGAYQVGDTFWNNFPRDGAEILGATVVRSIYAGMHFSKPASSQNSLIPSNAKVQTPGWKYGYFSGTSCAAPTVAGKVACMMEEYLHTNERWPTPNEAKDMLIGQAKHHDISATSTYWGRVPPPSDNFSMSSSKLNGRLNNRLNFDTKRPDFHTLTGLVEADSTGWRPVNTPSTTGVTINPSSIGEIDGKTVIASSSTNGKFQDGSGNIVAVGIGNKIVIGGGQSDLDDGTYTVKSITKPYGVSNKVFIVDRHIAEDQNGVPTSVTNFPSATFTLTKINVGVPFAPARVESLYRSMVENNLKKALVTGVLKNESGQGPAGMSCNVSIYKRDNVEFGYDPVAETHQTREGKIEIDVSAIKGAVNIKVGTSDGDGTFLDYNSCIATGTITPGEALTSVTQVATHSGNKMTSTPIYNQYHHNYWKLDGTEIASSQHRDRKTFGYRFSADSAVPHNSPMQIENESSPDLTEYNNVVGTNLYNDIYFDIKYQGSSAESIYETKKPFTAYSKVAWRWFNYPNSGGADFMNNQTMGSLSSTTFNDASGTSRTIRDLWWSEGQGEWRHPDVLAERPDHFYPQSDKGVLCFSLNGTNIPNTDNTFGSLEINGISFDRNTAYYSADSNGNTVWWWDLGCHPYVGSDSFKLEFYHHPGDQPIIWALNASHGNRVIFDTNTIPLGTGYDYDVTHKFTRVKLTISNLNPTVGYESYIDKVEVVPETWWRDTCIVKTMQNETMLSVPWDQYDLSEPCGTPPLWAYYDGRGVNLSNLDSLTEEETPTEGAVYPNNAQSIVAINEPVVSSKVSRVRGKRFIGTGLEPENENIDNSNIEIQGWEREEKDTDGRHDHDRDPQYDF